MLKCAPPLRAGDLDLLSRHRFSPYLGMRFRGRLRATLSRGRTVVRDGSVVAEPAGRLVRPAGAPPAP